MKKFILFISTSFFLVSCDNTKDYVLNNLNKNPVLKVLDNNNNGVELRDSVKLSLKSNMTSKTVYLSLKDENLNVKEITYKVLTGHVTVKLDGKTLDGKVPVDYNAFFLELSPKDIDVNTIQFTATDDFGGSSSVIVYLTGFDNLPPVANVTVIKDNSIQNAGLNYIIDASASFDKDYKYGGGVSLFDFTVNGVNVVWDKSKMNYIFPSAGSYTIKVRVRDLDGAWSDYVTPTFDIK